MLRLNHSSLVVFGIALALATACGGTTPTEPDASVPPDAAQAADANPNPCYRQPDGTACGDPSDTECDNPDSCLSGSCVTNYAAAGGACGDPVENECSGADVCDGAGSCSPNDYVADTSCGDPTESECDHADTCDGAGSCLQNIDPPDTPCGDVGDSDCLNPDICDGAGTCLANDEINGAACNDCPAGAGNCAACMDGVCLDNCSQSQLLTTFAGGNGFNGNMFDIVTLNDIRVMSFDANIDAGAHNMEIYYRVGGYSGYDTNAGAWTLLGTAIGVTSNGEGVATPIPINVDLFIGAGQRVGFYVTTQGTSMNYTNGGSEGNLLVNDANIQILEGIGKEYPFAGTYSVRNYNGIVHYETCQ